jgi:hypothetical protein
MTLLCSARSLFKIKMNFFPEFLISAAINSIVFLESNALSMINQRVFYWLITLAIIGCF